MQYETNPKLVCSDSIYVAIKNEYFDGHKYIELAKQNGAKKIIGENKIHGYKNYKKVKNTKEYLSKAIKKHNKLLLQNFKTICLINSTNENILYNTLNHLKVKCALLTSEHLFYERKRKYFNHNQFDEFLLNKILLELKDNQITHLILVLNSIDIPQFLNYKFSLLAIDNLCITTPKEINDINKISKKVEGAIIINSDDCNYHLVKRSSHHITIGNYGDYYVKDIISHKNYKIINFEHLYSKYSLTIHEYQSNNINTYLFTIILTTNLGYDLIDIVNLLNKKIIKKKD